MSKGSNISFIIIALKDLYETQETVMHQIYRKTYTYMQMFNYMHTAKYISVGHVHLIFGQWWIK